MGYGTLEYRFWEDPDLQELGLGGRAVAAYLLTSRHSTSEGYYRLSLGYVCDDLCIDRATASGYLQAIDLKNFARYDEASQVVFIRNAMRFRPPRGAKTITGALRRALEVPMNPFRSLFYDAAQHFAPEFASALAEAGFCHVDDAATQDTLFQRAPATAPAAVPEPTSPGDDTETETIMAVAARLSVQTSIANREMIRNPDAVARARLAQHRVQWQPIVAGWRGYFDASPIDMARALADGGKASPYWQVKPAVEVDAPVT